MKQPNGYMRNYIPARSLRSWSYDIRLVTPEQLAATAPLPVDHTKAEDFCVN